MNQSLINNNEYKIPKSQFFCVSENVRLEELYVRRRYVGQHVPTLGRLIKANAATLRIVGKIGLGEAIESFTGQALLFPH
jgi:hypothetical protein